jgi:esterase/lipase superfamily enzyme
MLQRKKHIHILTGQGPYESPDASRVVSAMLDYKGIPHELDVWGHDMGHDWPTWRAMMEFYLEAKL